jgi:hypothetical protein
MSVLVGARRLLGMLLRGRGGLLELSQVRSAIKLTRARAIAPPGQVIARVVKWAKPLNLRLAKNLGLTVTVDFHP